MPQTKKSFNKADLVFRRYKKAKELCQPVFDRVEANRNHYKGIMNIPDAYEWDYTLVDQQVFPLIRNYIARSNPAMTKIRLEHRKGEDIEKRQVNQDFVNWEINELPLTTLLTRGFFSNYLAGKAYYKTGWKYSPRVVVERDDYSYEMRPLINRADMGFVKFNNLLIPNRNIPDLYEQPFIIELIQLRVGDMIQDNETYGYEYWDNKFINKLRKAGVRSKLLDYEADFVKNEDTDLDESAFRSATFPVACMHTLENDLIYIPLVDDTDTIINKVQENPFWHGHYPYIDMTAFPEDDEFFPMSVVDAVADNQIASTETLNQTLTNVRQINNNMWVKGSGAASTPDWEFQQRPNGIISVVGDPNSVTQIRPLDSTGSLMRLNQELNTKGEKIGMISSLYSSGAGSRQINQTARGAQIIDQNIEGNIRMILNLFGEQVLKRMGEHFLELNAQFVEEEQSFAVTGKRGVRELMTFGPDVATANFDVYVMPEQMVQQTPASRQASIQNLMQIITQQAQAAGLQLDLVPMVEALIDSYPEMENVEDVVMSIDEKAKRDYLMLERGQMPEIKVRDPHMELIQAVSLRFEEMGQQYTPEVTELFEQYIQKHLMFLQSEQEIQMMAQPQLPQPQEAGALAGAMGETAGMPNPDGSGVDTYNLGAI
jgi:hypothetical protein